MATIPSNHETVPKSFFLESFIPKAVVDLSPTRRSKALPIVIPYEFSAINPNPPPTNPPPIRTCPGPAGNDNIPVTWTPENVPPTGL